jgi:nucleotide-binding universal stress UspA family protein
MKTIVVPLDGSAAAEQVLPYVRLLAGILAAQVHLLVVLTKDQRQRMITRCAESAAEPAGRDDTDWHWEHRALAELTRAAEAYLDRQAELLRATNLNVTFEVDSGEPAERIADIAASEPRAMIAMATHGYSGLRRWTLGSVADKVVHITTSPVFLVRAVAQPAASARRLKRILVPLDGSALAEQALPHAIALARRAPAAVVLLQVAIPLIEYAPGMSPFNRPIPPSVKFPDVLREQAHARLAETIERYGTPEVEMTPLVVFGHPAEAIVDAAIERHVDLIVMATHGYSGLRRWAMGNVADKVLHASPVPLLIVRAHAGERT